MNPSAPTCPHVILLLATLTWRNCLRTTLPPAVADARIGPRNRGRIEVLMRHDRHERSAHVHRTIGTTEE